jgi:hypothetical protein
MGLLAYTATVVASVIVTLAVSIFDHLDIWAPVANTVALIALGYMARRNGAASNRNADAIAAVDATSNSNADAIAAVHADVTHTASAAAAAAAAAAEAARAAKDMGATIGVMGITTLEQREPPDAR